MEVEIMMNKITRSNLSRTILFILPILTITACAVLPGTLEVSLQPEAQVLTHTLVLEELKPVLDSILFGSIDQRRELVSYTTTACTTADGLGGPPKCERGQVEGTLVQVLPILSGEGTFSTPENIDQALDFVVMDLYAIYQVPQDAFQADYWPAGEYGLIFSREMNAVPMPLTVFIEDGRIVRIQHHMATEPQDLIDQLPVESIVITPNNAQELMAELEPESPQVEYIDNGTVTGSVCFPGESIPEMTLYFEEINRGDLAYQGHLQDQDSYSIILPPGTYIAYAYPENDPVVGGMYSQAVACGLGAECTDHAPIKFEVNPSEETGNVDICDWYSQEDVPPNPQVEMESESGEIPGTISGKVCFPGGHLPEMTLFIQEVSTGQMTELPIAENQTSYSIDLEPGRYIAFAYINSGATFGGAYSNLVVCGFEDLCSDHTLVEFDVLSGHALNEIDICDWYSLSSLPPDPRVTMEPFAGMVYRSKEGEYFWVEANGNSRLIHQGSELAIPYSGPFGVYFENNDLQALNLFTGESYQLTNTPELRETSFHFEVGFPEELLFTALPVDQEVWPGYTGGLYMINMDGTDQRTIDDENNTANFAASGDGQKIAYGAGETAFIYSWDGGREVFDPREYGMDSPKGQAIASPSWSPAGVELAWSVNGFYNDEATQGYGIFDLTNKTFRLIHPYQGLGMDVTPHPAQWSPDGEWLVMSVFDQNPESSGVWLVNLLPPEQEFFMGPGTSNPVFGPWTRGKKILTYFRLDRESGESKTWAFDLLAGEHQLIPLPSDAQVITWQ
jgi:hypothetical protein